MKPICHTCGDSYPARRAALGYRLCLPCGEDVAKATKHTIVPLNKSNYIHVSDTSLLRGLNPKFTSSF